MKINVTFHFSLNRLRILRAKANFLKLKEVFVHVLLSRAPLLVRCRNHKSSRIFYFHLLLCCKNGDKISAQSHWIKKTMAKTIFACLWDYSFV